MNPPTLKLLADILQIDGIKFRPAMDDDLGYVLDTFGRSYRDEFPDMMTTDFAGWIRVHVARLLAEGSRVLIAHNEGSPEVIRGWIMFRDDAIDYVYVRNSHRHLGLGRRLMNAASVAAPFVATHVTNTARAIKKAGAAFRYVPAA